MSDDLDKMYPSLTRLPELLAELERRRRFCAVIMARIDASGGKCDECMSSDPSVAVVIADERAALAKVRP